MHFARGAEQILYMVADFVRDDIGLREIARCAELAAHLLVKRQVDVRLFISRAIERPIAACPVPHAERVEPVNSTSVGSRYSPPLSLKI